MKDKSNIEDIKQLIPDYITGSLDESEKFEVEKALQESSDLKSFYSDMKDTFEFVGNVKFEEPSPQYWSTLLPRIHEKIDARQSKKFSWGNIAAFWKIAVPVAAVIVIFMVYRVLISPEKQITNKENKDKLELINKDTSGNIENKKDEQNKQTMEHKDNTADNNEEDNDEQGNNQNPIRHIYVNPENENVSEDNNDMKMDENRKNDDVHTDKDMLASIDSDDVLSVLSTGTPGTIDEETEHEINKLNNSEKDELLKELQMSNL